tara:strand:- start:580 stop:1224 length:645 start_codon:yes stop_codon:yes gene_type:complete
MELFKNAFFINLERRKDRLEHVKNELNKMNIKGERFKGIETTDGAIGCTLSHIRLLEIAIENNLENIFICEDDITFLDCDLLKLQINKFKKNIKDWDVLIVGGNVVKPFKNIGNYCLKITNCQTTTGYIVNNNYFSKLRDNFREGLKLLINTLNKKEFAIDIYWKRLQKEDNWYLLYPLTVTQFENYSDIEKRTTNYNHLMLDSEKKWLNILNI